MEALGVRQAINSLYKSPYQEKDAAEEKLWKVSLFAVDMTSERSQDGTVEGLVAVTKHPHTPSYTHPPTQPLLVWVFNLSSATKTEEISITVQRTGYFKFISKETADIS